MFGRTLIISGGVVDISFVRNYLKDKDFDTIVCADSGLDTAYQLGLPVHYAMGDFDSVSKEVFAKYREMEVESGVHTEFITYPPEKDATDTHIVLDWVTEQKPEEILILGATGKRLDHFLANVNILMKPMEYGIPTYIVDKNNKMYMINKKHFIQREKLFGKYISLIPFTEKVSEVYLKNFKYELAGRTLTLGDSIGVSNELGEGKDWASIEFREGVLLVVESRD